MKVEEKNQEFERQIKNLLKKKYPQKTGLDENNFLKNVRQLKEKLSILDVLEADFEAGYLPFVIIVKSEVIETEKAMSLVEREGKHGFTKMYPHSPKDFSPIKGIYIPEGTAYLLVNIDRGKYTRNITPNEALKIIQKQGRTPLTIEEGVSIMTHFPEFLKKNNCFSLLASRHTDDQRVPAIWINSEKRPNLGWCWNGNPHTWLGSASAAQRVGI